MHKKLASDLISLAHSVLQMKDKEDVLLLKEKAHKIYEKLSVLAYVEEYINTTPNALKTKEEILTKIKEADTVQEKIVEEIDEQPFDELEKLITPSNDFKDDIKDVGERKNTTLEEELKDTISVDIVANLFEKTGLQKTLNDHVHKNIQIGLNDRIAFVKNLFNGNQEDFNRVISQLNTFQTEKEAKKFIAKMMKSDYDWSEKEEFEQRFITIVEKKFI